MQLPWRTASLARHGLGFLQTAPLSSDLGRKELDQQGSKYLQNVIIFPSSSPFPPPPLHPPSITTDLGCVEVTCAQSDPAVRGRVVSVDGIFLVPCVPKDSKDVLPADRWSQLSNSGQSVIGAGPIILGEIPM